MQNATGHDRSNGYFEASISRHWNVFLARDLPRGSLPQVVALIYGSRTVTSSTVHGTGLLIDVPNVFLRDLL